MDIVLSEHESESDAYIMYADGISIGTLTLDGIRCIFWSLYFNMGGLRCNGVQIYKATGSTVTIYHNESSINVDYSVMLNRFKDAVYTADPDASADIVCHRLDDDTVAVIVDFEFAHFVIDELKIPVVHHIITNTESEFSFDDTAMIVRHYRGHLFVLTVRYNNVELRRTAIPYAMFEAVTDFLQNETRNSAPEPQ